MVRAPAAAYGRPVGLLDPGQRLGSVALAFSLRPVKVFSSEGMSTVDKQSLEECPQCGNLLYLPVGTALPASCVSPGNDVLGISCSEAGVYFSCSNEC